MGYRAACESGPINEGRPDEDRSYYFVCYSSFDPTCLLVGVNAYRHCAWSNPKPSPDLDATVEAWIAATMEAERSIEATVTSRVEATKEAEPTSTPEPTPTPEPTSTPEPTPTPAPSSATYSSLTTDEEERLLSDYFDCFKEMRI